MNSTTINRNRDRSATLVALTLATLVCGLGLLSNYVSIPLVLLTLAGIVLAAWVVARVARTLRWRREDRADALVAAAWRAAHPRPTRPARTVQGVA
jgi:hypothetical protein